MIKHAENHLFDVHFVPEYFAEEKGKIHHLLTPLPEQFAEQNGKN